MEHADWPDLGHMTEWERNALPRKVRVVLAEGGMGWGAGQVEEQELLMWKGRAWGD